MKKIILPLLTAFLVQPVVAHEGHGDMPGTLKSSHGGTVLAGKEINLEYITSGTELKIYPVSHEGDTLNTNKVKVSATAKIPKGKTENLKLEPKEDAYVTTVDLKKSHRAEVTVTTEANGKKDNFKFQVEK
ncbi:MAG: hypothetical protein ACXVCP_10225 [Bdellovibrio sp.]